MPQEIVSQSDYYGLPQPSRDPAPAPEKVADLLKAPTPWSGPTKRDAGNHPLKGPRHEYPDEAPDVEQLRQEHQVSPLLGDQGSRGDALGWPGFPPTEEEMEEIRNREPVDLSGGNHGDAYGQHGDIAHWPGLI